MDRNRLDSKYSCLYGKS